MRLRIALILTVSLAVGGCGEQRGDATRTTPRPVRPPPTIPRRAVAVVSASLSEYAIGPTDPTVRRKGWITFVATNDGTVPHALAVDGPKGPKRTSTLLPGEEATITLHLPPGQYRWYCPLGDHERRGMVGRVNVAE
jgi:plastocyanin